MLRNAWGFEFTASALATAATEKKAHHEDRVKFWETAKEAVMKEVRETGIEVNESLAASYSNKSAGFGPWPARRLIFAASPTRPAPARSCLMRPTWEGCAA